MLVIHFMVLAHPAPGTRYHLPVTEHGTLFKCLMK